MNHGDQTECQVSPSKYDFTIKLTFPHAQHQARLKECKLCHGAAGPGKIAGFSKDWAHKTCKGCHEKNGAGPTKCTECHKKK